MRRKRIRIIVAAMIALLLLTGAAYAAWTASVVVETSASSGHLDVEIQNPQVLNKSTYVNFTSDNIVISADKHTAEVSISNNYPGSEARFTVDVVNTGTIPVKMTESVHDTRTIVDTKTGQVYQPYKTSTAALFQYINAEYYIEVYNAENVLIDATATRNTVYANWVEVYYANNTLPAIEPGGYIKLYIRVYFSSSAPETIENKAFNFAMIPKFEQAT